MKKFNEARLLGESTLRIPKFDVSEDDLEEIEQCGYSVQIVKDEKKGDMVVISE